MMADQGQSPFGANMRRVLSQTLLWLMCTDSTAGFEPITACLVIEKAKQKTCRARSYLLISREEKRRINVAFCNSLGLIHELNLCVCSCMSDILADIVLYGTTSALSWATVVVEITIVGILITRDEHPPKKNLIG